SVGQSEHAELLGDQYEQSRQAEPQLSVPVQRAITGEAVLREAAHGGGAPDVRRLLKRIGTPDLLSGDPERQRGLQRDSRREVSRRFAVRFTERRGHVVCCRIPASAKRQQSASTGGARPIAAIHPELRLGADLQEICAPVRAHRIDEASRRSGGVRELEDRPDREPRLAGPRDERWSNQILRLTNPVSVVRLARHRLVAESVESHNLDPRASQFETRVQSPYHIAEVAAERPPEGLRRRRVAYAEVELRLVGILPEAEPRAGLPDTRQDTQVRSERETY